MSFEARLNTYVCKAAIIPVMLIALVLLLNGIGLAATITSAQTGPWNTTSTWSPAQVPTSADSVVISTGHTVTVNISNAVCKNILIGTTTGTGTLAFAASSQLTISNALHVGKTGAGTGALDMTNGGTLIWKTASVISGKATLTPGAGTIEISHPSNSETVPSVTNFNTYNNLIIDATGSLTANITINGDLTVNSFATLDLAAFTANRATSGGTIAIGFLGELQIGGTRTFPSNYVTVSLDTLSTVTYNGSTQTVAAETYGYLNIYNSGTKTLAGNTTVKWSISNNYGATFADGGHTLTLGADFQNITGTISSTGTLVCDGSGNTSQSISGFTSLHNLTMNGPAGGNVTVPATFSCSTLTLTSGTVTTSGTLTATTLSGGSSSSYVSGGLSAQATGGTPTMFPVGKSGYAPVTFTPATTTSFTLYETTGEPTGVVDNTNVLFRTYHISSAGVTTTVVFGYADADVHGNEASYEAAIFNGQWDVLVSSENAGANTCTLTSYAMPSAQYDWTLGKRAALPIEMSVFTGLVNANHGVALTWTTVTETNNLGFAVQRKADGAAAYADISGLIAGSGTTLEQHEYTYTDQSVSTGTWYYRLKMTDATGNISYSSEIRIVNGALGVNEGKPATFGLAQNYPNPFNPTTTIAFGLAAKADVTLGVYDAVGRLVATLLSGETLEVGEHSTRFDAAGLASGVYYYRLTVDGLNEHRVAAGKMTILK